MSLNEAVAQRFDDCFGLGVDLQFAVDVSHMKADGVDAASKFGGSRLMTVAFYKQLQQTDFVRSQLIIGFRGRADSSEE